MFIDELTSEHDQEKFIYRKDEQLMLSMDISDGGDSKVSNGSQSNSIQKVLFDKKPEFHSTQMNVSFVLSTTLVDIYFWYLTKTTCY